MPSMPNSKPPDQVAPPEHAYIVIDGRRWRASDPDIPANLRQELVNELMAARRAVRGSTSNGATAQSRRRVNDAKLALGERGRPWWLPPTPASVQRRIDAAMVALLRSRAAGKSICPSDVARIAGGKQWRGLLPLVRARAADMSARGQLEIRRANQVVQVDPTEGVLRYRLTAR